MIEKIFGFRNSIQNVESDGVKPTKNSALYIGLATLSINMLSLLFPLFLLQIYDRIIPNQSYHTLLLLFIAVISALMFEFVLKVCRANLVTWIDARQNYQLGRELFSKTINCDINAYDKIHIGAHLENILSFTKTHDFYGSQALTHLLDIPFTVIYMLLIWYIGGFLVFIPVAFTIVSIILLYYMTNKIQKTLQDLRVSSDIKTNLFINILRSIHIIKTMSMENFILRKFERLQKEYGVNDYKLNLNTSLTYIAINAIAQLSILLIICLGCILVIQGKLTIGALAACTLLSTRSLQPIMQSILVWRRTQNVKITQGRLSDIKKLPSEKIIPHETSKLINGKITFDNVSFITEENKTLFEAVNLTILPNETVAITGKSFSGKTTLLNMILGIAQPRKGKIYIDDICINEYDVQRLRKNIALINHEDVLFKGTILDNVTLFNNEQLEYDAKKILSDLSLDLFINQMPDGYDTEVGDIISDYLPKGVKQRICIARAFLKQPKILLVDQGSVMLDQHSDNVLKNFLKHYKGKQTMIIVSHKPCILEIADRILTIENNRISG
ncbi:MAG: ABC transporter transmembrane domain-containing protein [Gammaproteobacteria bacterium]